MTSNMSSAHGKDWNKILREYLSLSDGITDRFNFL